jgi:hypothetical protein
MSALELLPISASSSSLSVRHYDSIQPATFHQIWIMLPPRRRFILVFVCFLISTLIPTITNILTYTSMNSMCFRVTHEAGHLSQNQHSGLPFTRNGLPDDTLRPVDSKAKVEHSRMKDQSLIRSHHVKDVPNQDISEMNEDSDVDPWPDEDSTLESVPDHQVDSLSDTDFCRIVVSCSPSSMEQSKSESSHVVVVPHSDMKDPMKPHVVFNRNHTTLVVHALSQLIERLNGCGIGYDACNN